MEGGGVKTLRTRNFSHVKFFCATNNADKLISVGNGKESYAHSNELIRFFLASWDLIGVMLKNIE